MREWQLGNGSPMAPRIAADARTGRTHYHDDQTWQLQLGRPEEAALALETRYGGRVGLARLVPIWTIGRRQVFEAQGYHRAPVLTAFAPDYLRAEADLTLWLRVTFEFWAAESQAVVGRITVHNRGDQPQSAHLALAAQIVRQEQTLRAIFLALDNGDTALQLGKLSHLQPVLLLESGASGGQTHPRLGRALEVAPGAQIAVRWALGSLPDRDASLTLAHRWLNQTHWDDELAAVERRAAAVPQIESGDAEWDAALAWSSQIVLRSFLGATGSLPYPSFVSARLPATGYAISGTHAEGFNAGWGGQTLPEALQIAPLVALAAPSLARGLVRNFLAVQRDDGWIDAKPGLDGQRTHVLAPPLLATLALTVYHYTRDRAFLAESLDGLVAFFHRWLASDVDQDRDGIPEWQHPGQGANPESPTFAVNRRWSQGVDVTTIEAPDLLTYLAREAASLQHVAEIVDRADVAADFRARAAALAERLLTLWDGERGVFHYQDRDTHSCPQGAPIYEAKGDQPLRERTELPQASRLILRVIGGMSHRPKLSCTIEGIDGAGNGANETIPGDAFDWYRGMGTATTRTVWRTITDLSFSGLSRVYRVQASTVDLSLHDVALLTPLWVRALDGTPAERTLALLTDPAAYWRPFGVAGCPADRPPDDAPGGEGCGGSALRYNALLAWALLDRGQVVPARELFERVLRAQIRALREQHAFRAAYNPETGDGAGEGDAITGAVPFGWFARLFGGFVLGPDAAMITAPCAFDGPIAWTQHGVRLERRAEGTTVTFPTGHTVELPPDAAPQIVRDPTFQPGQDAAPAPQPAAPPDEPAPTDDRELPLPPESGLLPAID